MLSEVGNGPELPRDRASSAWGPDVGNWGVGELSGVSSVHGIHKGYIVLLFSAWIKSGQFSCNIRLG